jgi:hypothetical protein
MKLTSIIENADSVISSIKNELEHVMQAAEASLSAVHNSIDETPM